MSKAKITLVFLVCILSLNIAVFGSYCACCAEHGAYQVSVKKLSEYELGELKKLKISTVQLYTDMGYPDDIMGLNPISEDYSGVFNLQKQLWKFDFSSDGKKVGNLNLSVPPAMIDFRADNHANENGEATLYKEIRFKAKVASGNGIFQKGLDSATNYFLVFQGTGNNCMNAEDFTHWRLAISDKKASYAFFGKLAVAK